MEAVLNVRLNIPQSDMRFFGELVTIETTTNRPVKSNY